MLTADYVPGNWSGIGAAVEYQTRALVELDIQVDVLIGGRGSATDVDLPADAAPPNPRVGRLGRRRFPAAWSEFDVIHLHSLALSELAFELRRRTRKPLVYTAHSLLWLELEPRPDVRFWCEVQERVLAGVEHVVFLSRAERDAACERIAGLAGRCSIVPNGVPEPTTVRQSDPDDGPIVFAGRFTRTKGVDLVADMLPRLGWTFVLAGGHGDAVGEGLVHRLANEYGPRCTVRGWLAHDELEAVYRQASLVLVPSRYEPCGLVALEAMRLGTPVLAAAVGGLVEVVGPGSGGRLVDGADVETWCAAAERILNNKVLRGELRACGPRHVRRRFNNRQMARRLLGEVYAA